MVDGRWNDAIDHVVTGALALVAITVGAVIYLQTGQTPSWLVAIASLASGFYFRGRVNGQYNHSKMGQLERMADELRQAKETIDRLLTLTRIEEEGGRRR